MMRRIAALSPRPVLGSHYFMKVRYAGRFQHAKRQSV